MSQQTNRPSGRPEGERPVRKKRRGRGRRIFGAAFYVIFVIGVSALLAAAGWVLANDVLALNKPELTAPISLPEDIFTYSTTTDEDGDTVTVSQVDMDYVTDLLKSEGLIEYKWLFKLFCAITGGDEKITAGTYELSSDMDYRAIIQNISAASAARQEITVTIPEGLTVAQTFALLEDAGVSTVEKLNNMAATHDYAFSFLQEIPLGDPNRLEGYLFPDTYDFYIGENPLYVINKMLVNFDARVTDEMRQEIWDSGRTIHEVVTVASMIEKETDGTDHAKISSVIYNRLTNNAGGTYGFLQIDATLVYINGGKTPTEADKAIDSPYNTYLYTGLPAGPIANPGMAAIKAAMEPDETGYYYYALNPETGRHEFSYTYDEHLNRLAGYQSNG